MASNETAAVAALKSLHDAQKIYRRTDWDDDGELAYASSITGDFSLYETAKGLGDVQLVTECIASASESGGFEEPCNGYFFRRLDDPVLEAMHARSVLIGKLDQSKEMLVYIASPNEWDHTGRNTFLISDHGTIYQADLGEWTTPLFLEDPLAAVQRGKLDVQWIVSE